jgi:hypothetical protein
VAHSGPEELDLWATGRAFSSVVGLIFQIDNIGIGHNIPSKTWES